MESILENIIHSPKINIYFQKIKDILSEEQKKREEFYKTMKENEKVEFINGEILFQSPVKLQHDKSSSSLFTLVKTYVEIHNLGYVGHEKLLISLSRNDYEPDICFFSKSKSEKFHSKQMQFPAPDLIVEILSESTEGKDRGIKFEDYAIHGVGEYWIIDPETQFVEQYILEGETYHLLIKSDSGLIKSRIIPGFEIPINAIFDSNENLKVLQDILKSIK